MTTTFAHYGLHFTESGIGLLIQDVPPQNAHGLDFHMVVQVQKPKRTLLCPHEIELHRTSDLAAPSDALFELMYPLPNMPGSPPVFVPEGELMALLLQELLRLSSPTGGIGSVFPLWVHSIQTLTEHLQLTNLQPLVVNGYSFQQHKKLLRLLEIARTTPRRLIILMPRDAMVTFRNIIETDLNLEQLRKLPLEQMGAKKLVNYMISEGQNRVHSTNH